MITIGILGAFALNNWNDNRARTIKEAQSLDQLLSELKEDELFLESIIDASERNVDYLDDVINKEPRSLDSMAMWLNRYSIFIGVNSKYLSLKNGDQIGIISNQKLLDQIVQYYETDYIWTNEWASYNKDLVQRNVEPYILKNLPVDKDGLTDSQVVRNKLEDFEFVNIINSQISVNDNIVFWFERSLGRNRALQLAIQTERAK